MKKTSDIICVKTIANSQEAIKTKRHWEFWSYNTLICIIDLDSQQHYFTKDWNYSIKTTKYLKEFLNMYSFNFGFDHSTQDLIDLIAEKQIRMI